MVMLISSVISVQAIDINIDALDFSNENEEEQEECFYIAYASSHYNVLLSQPLPKEAFGEEKPQYNNPQTSYAKLLDSIMSHSGSSFHSGHVSGGSAAPAVEPEPSRFDAFTDLDAAAWYREGVSFVLDEDLMNGISKTLFAPDADTTRAMMMTILARMDGCDTEGGATWYENGLAWAKTNGVSDGTDPEKTITREEFAAMLYRYAQSQGEGFTGAWMFLLDFSDAATISEWANEAMHWCVMKGILTGDEGKLLRPQSPLTRAEAATMIERFAVTLQ